MKNKKWTSERDQYIIKKSNEGMGPTEIIVLMEGEGFKPVTRQRIHQILEAAKKQNA